MDAMLLLAVKPVNNLSIIIVHTYPVYVVAINTEICDTDKNLTRQTLKVSSVAYGNVKIQIFERGGLWNGSKQNCPLTKMPAKWDSTVYSVTVERWCSIAFMMRGYILALRCCPERKWVISQFFFQSNVCPSVCRAAGRARRDWVDSTVFQKAWTD